MASPPRPPWIARNAWVIAPLLLAAMGAGFAVVRFGPASIGVWTLAALGIGALLWTLSAAFWPASADRSCPACGKETLERMDPNTTIGLRCSACGHEDPEASGWLLAEDEGALDEILEHGRRNQR